MLVADPPSLALHCVCLSRLPWKPTRPRCLSPSDSGILTGREGLGRCRCPWRADVDQPSRRRSCRAVLMPWAHSVTTAHSGSPRPTVQAPQLSSLPGLVLSFAALFPPSLLCRRSSDPDPRPGSAMLSACVLAGPQWAWSPPSPAPISFALCPRRPFPVVATALMGWEHYLCFIFTQPVCTY